MRDQCVLLVDRINEANFVPTVGPQPIQPTDGAIRHATSRLRVGLTGQMANGSEGRRVRGLMDHYRRLRGRISRMGIPAHKAPRKTLLTFSLSVPASSQRMVIPARRATSTYG